MRGATGSEGCGWARAAVPSIWWHNHGEGWWSDCRIYARPYGSNEGVHRNGHRGWVVTGRGVAGRSGDGLSGWDVAERVLQGAPV